MSTNFEKIELQLFVLSIALARPGTISQVVREITHIKKSIKTYNFKIKCAKVYLTLVYIYQTIIFAV